MKLNLFECMLILRHLWTCRQRCPQRLTKAQGKVRDRDRNLVFDSGALYRSEEHCPGSLQCEKRRRSSIWLIVQTIRFRIKQIWLQVSEHIHYVTSSLGTSAFPPPPPPNNRLEIQSQTIQFTILKCIIQWLSVYS